MPHKKRTTGSSSLHRSRRPAHVARRTTSLYVTARPESSRLNARQGITVRWPLPGQGASPASNIPAPGSSSPSRCGWRSPFGSNVKTAVQFSRHKVAPCGALRVSCWRAHRCSSAAAQTHPRRSQIRARSNAASRLAVAEAGSFLTSHACHSSPPRADARATTVCRPRSTQRASNVWQRIRASCDQATRDDRLVKKVKT